MNNVINNAVCFSLLFMSGSASAMFVNGSFEEGLSGWSRIGYVRQTSHWSSHGNYSVALVPTVALSEIESGLGLTGNSLDVVASLVSPELTGSINASIAYQTFAVHAGDRIDFGFDVKGTESINNWNYSSVIFIESGVLSEYYSLTSLISAKDSTCDCFCESGAGMFNVSVSGIATIGFMIINQSDLSKNPVIKLDNINAGISEVPVPAAAWLFMSGLFYMTLFVRKKRK